MNTKQLNKSNHSLIERWRRLIHKRATKIVLAVFGVLILGGSIGFSMYVKSNQTLFLTKQTAYGVELGGYDASQASEVLGSKVLAHTIRVSGGDIEKSHTPDELGFSIDQVALSASLTERNLGVYLKSFFEVDDINNLIALEESILETQITQFAESLAINPVTKKVQTFKSGKADKVVIEGKVGRQVSNLNRLIDEIKSFTSDPRDMVLEFEFSETDFNTEKVEVDDTKVTTSKFAGSYTYSIESRGGITTDIETFAALAAETLADSKGWLRAGAIFTRVESGGDFRLILATAAQVGAASPTCSTKWSCRAGKLVLINEDRWTGATDSWNTAGGSLRDYRHMVINHEVGHFIGNGHKSCPGVGQLAPVMQQQSIDLQGCKHNPWPLDSEV